jgi:phosphopantothenoylcysteine decarboxylase/phosphopantothenate--cysteine ligase
MTGSGRLADTQILVDAVLETLDRRSDLAGETVLITAGGTREAIDPVRFLGNRSSGKMGYALAKAAQERGARVILVSAPTALACPAGCELIEVTSAEQMRRAVLEQLPRATVVIGAAAVSDFRPVAAATEKLRRTGRLMLELEPTEDILAEVGERRAKGTILIAFAAETDSANSIENGQEKLRRKGADAIVVNDVSLPGLGFDSESNAATLLTGTGSRELPPMSKLRLANQILNEVANLRSAARRQLETV